jgi:hypothetical protein
MLTHGPTPRTAHKGGGQRGVLECRRFVQLDVRPVWQCDAAELPLGGECNVQRRRDSPVTAHAVHKCLRNVRACVLLGARREWLRKYAHCSMWRNHLH